MTQELHELERGFWNAAGDGGYYVENMAPDGLCVLPIGVLDKKTTVSAISQADPWDEFEFSDLHVIDLGDDEAAICYRADANRGDNEYTALISSVYTRHHGDWKLTLHQQTPINKR
jgi:hypothetical protein